LVGKSLLPKVTNASINNEFLGSDHCPVTLEINLS